MTIYLKAQHEKMLSVGPSSEEWCPQTKWSVSANRKAHLFSLFYTQCIFDLEVSVSRQGHVGT